MNVTPYQLDAWTELFNIGVGRAAGMLNQLLHTPVGLQVPSVEVVSSDELRTHTAERFGTERLAAVQLAFTGTFSGNAALVFPPASASKLVDVITEEDSPSVDMDAIRTGTLTEVGNIVLNGVMGSIGNILKQRIHYTIPAYMEAAIDALLTLDNANMGTTVLIAQTRFTIEQYRIEGDILLLFEIGSFDTLLSAIDALPEH